MFLVHIEFRRVQTFLFTVPRLRAMVGANALLGETLRRRLPELAGECGASPPLPPPRFPPMDVAHDPLRAADDAEADLRAGVLSRDGGHFEAVFPDRSGAAAFAARAREVLRAEVPGLLFDADVSEVGGAPEPPSRALAPSVVDLPHFHACELTGNGPASVQLPDQAWASLSAKRRLDAGLRCADGQTQDIVGLMQPHLTRGRPPQDFEELSAGGYLAVVYADGNGVGARAAGGGSGDLANRIRAQAFFRTTRAANRAAVRDALPTEVSQPDREARPYQLLMLGGDDLLLACQARFALPFVTAYAQELSRYPLLDGKPLTAGVGVAIARHTVPFHHLHAIAESLADSAKRLYRGLPEDRKASVADWAGFSASWSEDPIETRRREWLVRVRGWQLVLTGRPLPILGDGLDSVQGLVCRAERLEHAVRTGSAARSQLRRLVDELRRGRLHGRVAFAQLAPETRMALGEAGIVDAWQDDDAEQRWVLSRIPDLVDVFEIGRLGRSPNSGASGRATPVGGAAS